MKRLTLALAVCGTLGLMAGVAHLGADGVVLEQNPYNHDVTITYSVEEEPGIVVMELLTNDVVLSQNIWMNMTGRANLNRVVQPGTYVHKWKPYETWPDVVVSNGVLRARVTVYPKDDPPDFLYLRLTGDDRTPLYFESDAQFPGGPIWDNDLYRREVYVMRRIHADHATFFMGSPENEAGRQTDGRETQRVCQLTNDFYMAIYPTTWAQNYYLTGRTVPDNVVGKQDTAMSEATYDWVRGSTAMGINWPQTGRGVFQPNGFLDCVRQSNPAWDFVLDLPTHAQYEFATRAGTQTPDYRSGTPYPQGAFSAGDGHPVGKCPPNAWQLYDMTGYQWTWVLDWYECPVSGEAVIDPPGPASNPSGYRCRVGASIAWSANCRSAICGGDLPSGTFCTRFCVMLP